MTDEKKQIKSKIFAGDEHDEFLKDLTLGDIVATPFGPGGILYHVGVYIGPRKNPHWLLKEYLKGMNISCPHCHEDLVQMDWSKDCGCNAHFVAELYLKKDEKGAMSLFGSFSKGESTDDTKYSIKTLKKFMENTGAFKFNFKDEDSRFKVSPTDEILKRSLKMVKKQEYRKESMKKYHLLDNNCQHFASFCRYGKPASIQVETAEKIIIGGLVGLGGLGYVGISLTAVYLFLPKETPMKKPASEAGSDECKAEKRPKPDS